jgi:phosphate transport system permease protein
MTKIASDVLSHSPVEGRNSRASMNSRQAQDQFARRSLFVISLTPTVLFLAISLALLLRFWPILQQYSLWELLSGTLWKPMKGLFGFRPFIAGTMWVTLVGVGLAVPPCILTSIYLSEFAGRTTRALLKPLLDVLAAIPSVVYGVWGGIAIVPFVGDVVRPVLSRWLGFLPFFSSNQPTGYSILSGGIVLAVMIAPFMIAVSYEVLQTIPNGWRQASLGLGATRYDRQRRVGHFARLWRDHGCVNGGRECAAAAGLDF